MSLPPPSSCSLSKCFSLEILVGALSCRPTRASVLSPLAHLSAHTHPGGPTRPRQKSSSAVCWSLQSTARLWTPHLNPLLPTQFNFTPNDQYLKFTPQTTINYRYPALPPLGSSPRPAASTSKPRLQPTPHLHLHCHLPSRHHLATTTSSYPFPKPTPSSS